MDAAPNYCNFLLRPITIDMGVIVTKDGYLWFKHYVPCITKTLFSFNLYVSTKPSQFSPN